MNTPLAACRGRTDLFYSKDQADQAAAKALCASCQLVVRCALVALRRREPAGIWGGLTSSDRELLVTELRRRAS